MSVRQRRGERERERERNSIMAAIKPILIYLFIAGLAVEQSANSYFTVIFMTFYVHSSSQTDHYLSF